VVEGRGEIGEMLLFPGQFDDAEQAVAQAPVFFLNQGGQRPQVAAVPKPMTRPIQRRRRRPREAAQKKEHPQPDRVSQAIGNETASSEKRRLAAIAPAAAVVSTCHSGAEPCKLPA